MQQNFEILTGNDRRLLYGLSSKLSRWVSQKIADGYDFLLLKEFVPFGDTYSYLQKQFPTHMMEFWVFGRNLEQPTPFVLKDNTVRYCYAFKVALVEDAELPQLN